MGRNEHHQAEKEGTDSFLSKGIVLDYVESQDKYKEVMGALYNNILLATATQVARTYVK